MLRRTASLGLAADPRRQPAPLSYVLRRKFMIAASQDLVGCVDHGVAVRVARLAYGVAEEKSNPGQGRKGEGPLRGHSGRVGPIWARTGPATQLGPRSPGDQSWGV